MATNILRKILRIKLAKSWIGSEVVQGFKVNISGDAIRKA